MPLQNSALKVPLTAAHTTRNADSKFETNPISRNDVGEVKVGLQPHTNPMMWKRNNLIQRGGIILQEINENSVNRNDRNVSSAAQPIKKTQ